MSEYIQRIFYEDVREKKLAGYGARHKASHSRKKDVVKTHVDSLTGAERIRYTSSICISTNVKEVKCVDIIGRINRDDIPSLQEIRDIGDYEKEQKVVAEIRRVKKNAELKSIWELNPLKLDAVFKEYNVSKTRAGVIINKEQLQDIKHQPILLEENYFMNISERFGNKELANFLLRLGEFLEPEEGQKYELILKIKKVK